MQKQYLLPIFKNALEKMNVPSDGLFFGLPNNPDHGDLSANIAMRLAKEMKKPPRAIAEEIIKNLSYDAEMIEKVDIAGAGFINVRFTNKFYTELLKMMQICGESFGRLDIGAGKTVNVEYVSANPTGLLHLGHGRNAAIGDTVANLFEWMGWKVTREYYFNNAGNQMNMLAKSIFARYCQIDNPEFEFPEDGYHGEYIRDIAEEIHKDKGTVLAAGNNEDMEFFRKTGENWCFGMIKKTLEAMTIRQEIFFNEDTLYSSGRIQQTIDQLSDLGLVYEKDGAKWLAFSKLGLEDDRVIVKSTGEATYRLPDIAYHKDKLDRGYDLVVDVFGADHIATVPDVMAAIKALGYNSEKVKVLIYQFVTLTENGQPVKMSKRSGKSYTLDQLLDEVGADVVRFFLLMRGSGTHLEFDLALAREQSDKNPVFYLQYAHARICQIFEKIKENSIAFVPGSEFSTELLTAPQEIELIKVLTRFPAVVRSSGEKFEPQFMAEYLREVAQAFHVFYHDCRIIGSEEKLLQARLLLAHTAKIVLRNGLRILGITTPERM